MSRPVRNERLAAKGRPKRRAAAKTHFFKYQLAGNPCRAEELELKRALQESLEEQQQQPKKSQQSQQGRMNQKARRSTHSIMISSTNSSDVSRSNNSSSSNESVGYILINSTPKKTRSNTSTPLNISSKKRAKLNPAINSNQSICDVVLNNTTKPPTGSPHVIRTYSRSQYSGTKDVQTNQKHTANGLESSASTPTPFSSTSSDRLANENSATKSKDSLELSLRTLSNSSLSRPNQAQNVNVKNDLVSTSIKSISDNNSASTDTSKQAEHQKSPPKLEPTPIQDNYLKFRRESKNYAYVKMTALKVSTQKSPSNNSKSSNLKKNLCNDTLNNNCKNSPRASLKTFKNQPTVGSTVSIDQQNDNGAIYSSASPKIGEQKHDTIKSTMVTNSLSGKNFSTDTSSSSKSKTQNGKDLDINKAARSVNNTPSSLNDQFTDVQQELSPIDDLESLDECVLEQTVDLSKKKNQNQPNVRVVRKRAVQGSWSLLGVPEEKVVYLRDDEPPRRLICYPAIKHIEGDVIQVRDSVFLRSGAKKTDLPYIAKICAFWEDAETGGVMMSLFWYYRPEHTEEGRKPHHLMDEIFASRHRDVDTVECIEDKCYVLTFNEYCRYKKRCKMEQVNTSWSLTDVTIPVSNESYPRRNRIPDSDVSQELVFCCRQIYDSRLRRLMKNPHINPKYGHI